MKYDKINAQLFIKNRKNIVPKTIDNPICVTLIKIVKADAIEKVIPDLVNNPRMLISVTPIPNGTRVNVPKIIELYITTVERKKLISIPNAKNPK